MKLLFCLWERWLSIESLKDFLEILPKMQIQKAMFQKSPFRIKFRIKIACFVCFLKLSRQKNARCFQGWRVGDGACFFSFAPGKLQKGAGSSSFFSGKLWNFGGVMAEGGGWNFLYKKPDRPARLHSITPLWQISMFPKPYSTVVN